MSDIAAKGTGYNVVGYQPGDQIGMGVVVDPANIKKAGKDYKLVTVDLNMNGQADAADTHVMVKLPPKGTIPTNWQGKANMSFGQKIGEAGGGIALGTIGGGIAGALGGLATHSLAESGHLGQFIARSKPGTAAVVTGVVAAALALGNYIGIKYCMGDTNRDEEAARNATVPDMVQPKYILNQHLLRQLQAGGTPVAVPTPAGK